MGFKACLAAAQGPFAHCIAFPPKLSVHWCASHGSWGHTHPLSHACDEAQLDMTDYTVASQSVVTLPRLLTRRPPVHHLSAGQSVIRQRPDRVLILSLCGVILRDPSPQHIPHRVNKARMPQSAPLLPPFARPVLYKAATCRIHHSIMPIALSL